MIETYTISERGYHPFLIREGWQLAKLNYVDDQHINNIKQLDIHLETDEVFIHVDGLAVLIVAEIIDEQPQFKIELMKAKGIYNIPKGVWHNIAMQEGSEVLIAEKANTHLSDFKHLELSEDKQNELKRKVNALFATVSL